MREHDTDDENVLGIYISSFHITKAIVNLKTRSIIESSYQRRPLNSRGSAEEIINTCCSEIEKTLKTDGVSVSKIGIAMPGPFDYEEGVSYIKNVKKYSTLYGLNIKQLIAEQLDISIENICMKNDAACFLKGEVFAGAAQGYDSAVGLIMGTGLGTARYANGLAEDADLWNKPFLDGIAEDYISTRWFLKRYYELSGLNTTSVMELSSFYQTSPTVKNIYKEFVNNLAIFIDHFTKSMSPEAVVLGGDISRAHNCFLPALKVQLSKMKNEVPVFVSKLNDAAPIIGAATCWLSADHSKEKTLEANV